MEGTLGWGVLKNYMLVIQLAFLDFFVSSVLRFVLFIVLCCESVP